MFEMDAVTRGTDGAWPYAALLSFQAIPRRLLGLDTITGGYPKAGLEFPTPLGIRRAVGSPFPAFRFVFVSRLADLGGLSHWLD